MKKSILVICLLILSAHVIAQDLSNLRGAAPFKIAGSIGTQNTFYTSNNQFSYRSPLSNTVFANLNLNVYGFDIPLSFYFSNNNRGFNHPFARFGMSPRYKGVQLHLGYRSMNFSPYTYGNITFLGGGIDANWKLARFAFFSGSLNQASQISPDMSGARPMAYHRNAFGLKLGVGNTRNYFDMILFNARDDTLSVGPTIGQHLRPKENMVLGSAFRLSLGHHVVISTNFAASAYNDNTRSTGLDIQELGAVSNYFTARYGSVLRYAGDIRANISLGKLMTVLQYRLIQPEFYSLGTTYMTNNIQSAGISMNTSAVKNKLVATLSMHYQSDNVNKTQLYTSGGFVMSINATARLSENLNVTAAYNGFNQQQRDGTAIVKDSLRIHRVMHNVTLAPTYNILGVSMSHTISVNLNSSLNRNQNKLIADPSDISTFAVGLNYALNLPAQKMNFTGNISHQNSSSNFYNFSSNGLTLGAGRRFLKDDNLNIQLHTGLSLGQVGGLSRNLSFMTGLNTTYAYQKNHMANLRVSLNQINNHHLAGLYSINGTDATISVGYTYRFTPWSVKKKQAAKPENTSN